MTNPTPPQVNPTGLSAEQVQQMIDAQLAKIQAQHKDEMVALQSQLEAMTAAMATRGVVSLVPTHGAGPGLEVAETWSQWEQEIARTGLGMPVHDYIKKLEGVEGGGNILVRVQHIEDGIANIRRVLDEVAAVAHGH